MFDPRLTDMAVRVFAQRTERDNQVKIGASNMSNPCNKCLAEDLLGIEREPTFAWMGAVIGTAIHGMAEERLTTDEELRELFHNPDVEQKLVLGEIEGYGEVKSTTDLYIPEMSICWDWKGLALDTPLPTPTGWTTMGDVQEGDYLLDRRGLPTRVIGKSDIKNIPCYEVSFLGSGSVIADEDHLWTIVKPTRGVPSPKEVVVSTPQLREYLEDGYPVRIRRHSGLAVQEDVALPIDPYVLGVWLGDGTSSNAELNLSDSRIADEVSSRGYVVGSPRNVSETGLCWRQTVHGLYSQLRECGLLNNKHIPQEYLRASSRQRFELLQGLMDTDGYLNKVRGNRVSVQTTKKWFADGLLELISSFGWPCSLNDITVHWDGKTGPGYALEFLPQEPVFCARQENVLSVTSTKSQYVYVKSVEPVDDTPTQCVMVDNADNLYLCGRWWVPTHNTTSRDKLAKLSKVIDMGLQVDPDSTTTRVYEDLMGYVFTVKKYLNQLHAYAMGCEKSGRPVNALAIAFVCRDARSGEDIKVFRFDYDPDHAQRVWDRVDTLWGMLEDGHTPDNFDGHQYCWYCQNKR